MTHKPDCQMSKNLSLLRSFSKYTPDSNKSKRNISIPTPAKVEEPIQIPGIDRKEKSEAGIHGLTESRFELGHDSQVIPISFKHQMDEIVKKGKLHNASSLGSEDHEVPNEKVQNVVKIEFEEKTVESNRKVYKTYPVHSLDGDNPNVKWVSWNLKDYQHQERYSLYHIGGSHIRLYTLALIDTQ